jgi:tetratricopeptide (TPR) repeat protein
VPPLSRALELEPRAAVVRLVLGTALATTGRTAAAAREYTAFVSACPEHPRATDILRLLGDYRRAREQSASAAEASEPVTLTAPTGKARAGGTALCDGQQLQGAARARYATGERYLKRARYAEAAGALERALEAEPRAAAAQLLLGTSYARLGQVDAGARAYESFLDACPEHPKAPTVRRLLADFRGVR